MLIWAEGQEMAFIWMELCALFLELIFVICLELIELRL